jgi:serine/threonine protein kinase/dienelactone hydrolase
MMANRNQLAETIFGAALDLPPGDRAAFLKSACAGAPDLREEIDSLLADFDRMGSFLGEPALGGSPSPRNPDDSGADSRPKIEGPAALPSGAMFGRYCVMERIGFGGMGSVYRARDERLGRTVAVKILTPGVLGGEAERRRFHMEAKALGRLSHAHIATVYDVGQQDGVDYIVMECVPGETLADRLEAGPLSVQHAAEIALQVAQALEEAHEQGIVHRDLKPANIMITPKGQVKVLDFGIAKLLTPSPGDATSNLTEAGGLVGTPLYMSPEQARGDSIDARSDLWSLGVIFYRSLTGRNPFEAQSTYALLHAIIHQEPPPLRQLRPGTPAMAEKIVQRALQKDPAERFQSAASMSRDFAELLNSITRSPTLAPTPSRRHSRLFVLAPVFAVLLALAAGAWFYVRSSHRQWARDQAPPKVNGLLEARKPLAAFLLLQQALRYAPADPGLTQLSAQNTVVSSIASSPAGATVEMQDYLEPNAPWYRVGVTPVRDVALPRGYFRWKISKAGAGESIVGAYTEKTSDFDLASSVAAPAGMAPVAAERFTEQAAFMGWLGPYNLPKYYVDRFEVTNREFQQFVDAGGYEKKEFWPATFNRDGHELSWSEAMALLRDTIGRAGPANWIAGHYPEGKAGLPVSGVSWYEASAFAAFAGKSLPVLAQWLQIAPVDLCNYTVPLSNMAGEGPAPVGSFKGVGPLGTYDTAGNVREWIANTVDDKFRLIMGGSWASPPYMYNLPEALPPFDRSESNGFRCVRNSAPLPVASQQPVTTNRRDFSHFKPASDDVFRAYQLLYEYPKTPLHSTVDGIVQETADWREEKVTFDTAYRGERMSAYLFLPRKVRPPYQTVLFFPSARVLFVPDNHGGRDLGDEKFFRYIIQSGRAVMYPIYEDTYERRIKFSLPGGGQNIELTTDWYKDAARSLDYLATRPDIDSSRLAYLGVSMGSAEGVIVSALMQDRLKTAILLDGGFFLDDAPPGGDQADFAPRIKRPVLMVNGRYDFTFPVEKSQNPLFNMLGTPPKDKSHIVLDTPHDVTEQLPQLTRAVLDWLDLYLGRVNE